MPNINALTHAKQQVEDDLLKRPGVTGVGVGYREKGGRETDEIVIRVYVAEKRPLDDVPPALRIPPEIRGFRTDVIEMGPAVHTGPTDVVRPLQGGVQIQVNCWLWEEYGTLGCLVWRYKTVPDPTDPSKEWRVPVGDAAYGLTAAHVMRPHGHDLIDDIVYQPASIVGFNKIGNQSDWKYGDKVDAGIVRLDYIGGPANLVNTDNVVMNIGPLSKKTKKAAFNDHVLKQGRTTNLTAGTVKDVSFSAEFDTGVKLQDLMLIKPDSQWPAFCGQGDSGAALVNDAHDLVGLVIGVVGGYYGAACHIDNVFEALKVAIHFGDPDIT